MLRPNYNGEKLTRAITKYGDYTNQMVLNDVCSYLVTTPEEMQPLD